MFKQVITLNTLIISAFLLFPCACNKTRAQQGPAFSTLEARQLDFQNWLTSLNSLDLNDASTSFSISSGGTSVYAKVTLGSEIIGAFVPENTSSNPNTEIAAFQLGRLLGYGYVFQPAVYWSLNANGVSKFRALLESLNPSQLPSGQRENYYNLYKKISNNPYQLEGSYKGWYQGKPLDYSPLEDASRVSNGGINSSHFLAQDIQALYPQPSNRLLSLLKSDKYSSFQERESELAKQLSVVVLVDALLGQWDRYSGGNISLLAVKEANGSKRIQIFAADNGGATLNSGAKWTNYQLSWVSRYDRNVVSELRKMNQFMKRQSSRYADSDSPEEFCKALGLRISIIDADRNANVMCQGFKRNLDLTVQSIEKNISAYGEASVFFN